MRRSADAPPIHLETRQRDADLEARYTYDREGFSSTLAYVSAYGPDLAAEYLDQWRPGLPDARSVREDLRRFEGWRFSAELPEMAHGMLLFHVLHRAFPTDPHITGSRLGKAQARQPVGVTEPEPDSDLGVV